jgi:hypothetical protein
MAEVDLKTARKLAGALESGKHSELFEECPVCWGPATIRALADEVERLRIRIASHDAYCRKLEETGDHGRFMTKPFRDALALEGKP